MAEKIVSRYFLGTFLASLSIIGFIQTMHVSLAYAEAETHLSPMGEEVRKQEAINEQLKKVGRLEIYGTPGPGRVLTMPNSPANLFVDVQSQKVRLTWSLVKDSVAYIVYVSLDGNNFKRLTHKPIKGSVYTAENLENDRMYYFAVESVSKWGKRSNKKIVSVSPQNDPIHGGRP